VAGNFIKCSRGLWGCRLPDPRLISGGSLPDHPLGGCRPQTLLFIQGAQPPEAPQRRIQTTFVQFLHLMGCQIRATRIMRFMSFAFAQQLPDMTLPVFRLSVVDLGGLSEAGGPKN
jgi:hypothetical protein